jgi:hypothetical protein
LTQRPTRRFDLPAGRGTASAIETLDESGGEMPLAYVSYPSITALK